MRRGAEIVLLGVLAAGLVRDARAGTPLDAVAAPGSETEAAGRTAEPSEAVIPVGDLAARLQELDQRLRAIQSPSHPTARGFRRLQSEVGEYLTEVDQLRADPQFELRTELPASAIDSIDAVWREAGDNLRKWELVLGKRMATMEALLAELDATAQLWRRSARSAADALPMVLAERVEGAIERIAGTEAVLRQRRDSILLLQDRIAEQLLHVDELEERADEATEALERSLWETDGPPLWRVLRGEASTASAWEQIRDASIAQARSLRRFATVHQRRILLHGILFLAVVAGLVVLRRGTEHWPTDDASLQAFAKTLNRPWAAGLLVALLPTGWIYPRGPLVVVKVVGLLLMVATVRVLSELLSRRLRWAMYLVIALYAAGNVTDLLLADAPLRRWLLLAIQLCGLPAAAWTIRGARRRARRPESRQTIWKIVELGGVAGLILLAGALAANVAGKVLLTSTWTLGVVRSGFLAIVGASAGWVLEGIWVAFLRSRAAAASNAVRRHGEMLRRRGTIAVRVGIPLLWLVLTLQIYRALAPIEDAFRSFLSANLKLREFEVSPGAVLAFVVVLGSAIALSRCLRFVLEEDVFPRTRVERGLAVTVTQTLHYALVLLGFLAAMAAAGVELSKFTILAGAFGVGLAFGMQNIVNNFISGLILLYERPIEIGDKIDIGEASGEVTRIGVRSSTVRTWEGAEVIVPNAELIAREVVNWTHSDLRRRIDLPVGVAYGTDPARVLDLLARAALEHPLVLQDPEPRAIFVGFGDSALNFSLRFWTASFDAFLQVRSEVGVRICGALAEAGISIPFPQRDVHVRNVPDPLRSGPAPAGGA